MQISPLELTGKHVSLEPLSEEHESGLIAAASDGELWNLWFTSVPKPENTKAHIATALAELKNSQSLPFVVRTKSDKKIVGTTRYCNIDQANRRLEIGYTWYAKSVQRTAVNTETKYLLLKHAFEELNCIAVEFRTHIENTRSRNAIMRLGAKQDGVLRQHKILTDGSYRDTVVFSILDSEWDSVSEYLRSRLVNR